MAHEAWRRWAGPAGLLLPACARTGVALGAPPGAVAPGAGAGQDPLWLALAIGAAIVALVGCAVLYRRVRRQDRILRRETEQRGSLESALRASRDPRHEEVRLARLRKISEMGVLMAEDPGAVFEHTVRMIGESFGVRVVCLSEIVGQELHFRAVFDRGSVISEAGRCALDVTPCATVERSGQVQVLDRVQERFPLATFLREHGARSYCGIPSVDGAGRVLAVTCLLDDREREYSAEEREILRVVGQRIAREVERRQESAERRQAEQALRESEERFRALADAAPVLLWMAGLDKQATYFNRTWLEFRGTTMEEEKRAGWSRSLHPEDRDRAVDEYERAFDERRPFTMEYRLSRGDGTYAWILDRGVPRQAPGGTFAGFIGTCTDITPVKDAEKALRESEARFRTMADSAPVMIWVAGSDKRGTYYNRTWLEAVGATLEEELREGWERHIHPEDRERALRVCMEGFLARREFSVEYRLVRGDGVVVWVLDRGVPRLTPDGTFAGFIGTCTDITQVKEAEETARRSEAGQRALLSASPDLLLRLSRDGRFLDWSPSRDFEPVVPPDRFLGRRIAEVLPAPVATACEDALARALTTGATQELAYELGEGEERRYFETSVAPIDGEEALVVVRDVTGRRRSERALAEAQEHYRTVIEAMPAGVLLVDTSGQIRACNAAAARIAGRTVQQILERSVGDPEWRVIDGSGRRVAPEEYPAAIAMRTGRTCTDVLLGVYRPDGTLAWIMANAVPLFRTGEAQPWAAVASYHDVTAQRRAEEALRRLVEGTTATGQEFFRSLVRAMAETMGVRHAVVAVTDPDDPLRVRTIAVWANGAPGENFERSLAGTPCEAVAAGETVFLRSGVAARYREDPVLGPLGVDSYLGMPLRGAGDRALGLLAVMHDGPIDESVQPEAMLRIFAARTAAELDRMRMEEDLRRSEAENRSLVQAIPDLLFRMRRDGTYLGYHGPPGARLLLPPEQFLGRTAREVLPPELAERVMAAIERTLSSGEPTTYEYETDRDGSPARWETRVLATGPDDVLLLLRDVTERVRAERALRESEGLLRDVIDGSLDRIFVKDLEGRYVRVNRADAEGFGRAIEEVVGATDFDLMTRDRAERVRAIDRRVVETGEPITYEEGPEDDPSATRTYLVSKFPRRDPAGRVIGVVGIARDITSLKRLEAELRQSQKMEAIGHLASGVAHDFNNLLSAIFAHTSLAKRTLSPNHPATRSLERVEESAAHAAGVTRSLLTFSRQSPAQKRLVRLNRVVGEAVRLIRRTLPATIRLDARLTDRPDLWVRADPTQVQQVLLNLAINARDAMPQGGTLSVALGSSAPGDWARLVVADSGSGMTPEVLGRIFEPFFTTKGPEQGTGLGLPIVHGIVTDHGGRIEVESEPGRGTVFTVLLPLAAAAPGENHGGKPEQVDGTSIVLGAGHRYIGELVASTLRSLGHSVALASDADEVLAEVRAGDGRVRLVVLDDDLSPRTGQDCLAELRAGGCGVPALLLVADGARALEVWASDSRTRVVGKPYQMADLADLASEMIERGVRKEGAE